MRLNDIKPMLWTRALKESITFYTDVLGFVLDEFNEEWGWASLHLDDIVIMVAKPNEHMTFEQPAFTGSLYINTDDVDYWWQRLKDQVKLCYDINNFEYGMREFAFYDNNGYLLQYGTPLPDDYSD